MVFPVGAVIGAVAGVGSAIFGASQQNKAQNRARSDQQKAIDNQYDYDIELYEARKQKTIAERDEVIRSIENRKYNDEVLAKFKDANALVSYDQSVKIRDVQQRQLNNAFLKSGALYDMAIGFNQRAASDAKRKQSRVLYEETQRFAFDNQEMIIEQLQKSGAARARGLAGRSADKVIQAIAFEQGVGEAQLNESLESIINTTIENFNDIDRAELQGNINAFGAKVLPPETIPEVPVPFKTPRAFYEYPRELQDFDFGPQPIKGVNSIPQSSWASSFANYIPGIVQAATPLIAQTFNPIPGGGTGGGGFSLMGQTSTFNPSVFTPGPFSNY